MTDGKSLYFDMTSPSIFAQRGDDALERLEDADIFSKAHRESRVLLTFDLDFGEIAALTEGRAVNIVVFRLRNARTPFVIERLSSVLVESSGAMREGSIISIEDSRHRIRRPLPIGKSGDDEPGNS